MIESEDVWIEKKTGKTVFIESLRTSYSSKGNKDYVCILNRNGKREEDILESTFLKNYEKVTPDYNKLLPAFLDFAMNDKELKRKLMILARRLHPGGYFHVGDVVYVTSPLCLNLDDFRYGRCLERPYQIESINPEGSIPLLSIITLRSIEWHDEQIRVPMYADRFIPTDAYTCLRRYDMPY